MFQNPQQRAGGGIMAGVAPVNMSEGGGFFSFEETPEGSGANLRDIALFIFDPNDPLDQASLALATVPGVNIVAKLTAMGLKGAKLYKQINKIEKFREATKNPAKYSAAASSALQAGSFGGTVINEAVDSDIGSTLSELASIAPELASQYFETPPFVEESTEEYPQETYNIESLGIIKSPEEKASSGISALANNIAEARRNKAETFRKGDKELAAVTAEDLEESGFDSLKDYLNNMEFNSDSGRYEPKGMAQGGIMRLKDGSDDEGVVAEVLDKDTQDFLDQMKITKEEFLDKNPQEQEAYVETYKNNLELKKDLSGNVLTRGIATIADGINAAVEEPLEIYRDLRYSDTGKALMSDPTERPENNSTYNQDINTLQGRTAPTLPEINESLAPPEVIEEVQADQGIVETTEREPGFIEKAYGALRSIYGMGDTDLEKRASRAARGPRPLGTSYDQMYNDELLKLQLGEAKIAQYVAATEEAQTNDIEEFVRTIRRYKPNLSEEAAVDIFLSTKNKTKSLTKADFIKDVVAQVKSIKEDIQSRSVYEREKKEGITTEGISYDSWVVNKAQKMTNAIYGMDEKLSEDSEFKIIGKS